MIEVKLIDGGFFKQFGLFEAQSNFILVPRFEFEIKEVIDGFKRRPIFLGGHFDDLGQVLRCGLKSQHDKLGSLCLGQLNFHEIKGQ